MVRQNLAVPVYYGLPPRPYTVLGEIATSKGQTWAWSDVQSEAMEQAAVEAKKRGADAIIRHKARCFGQRILQHWLSYCGWQHRDWKRRHDAGADRTCSRDSNQVLVITLTVNRRNTR